MRYLLIVLIALLVVWRWKAARAGVQHKPQQTPNTTPTAQTMVCCNHCGLHVPANDALTGSKGSYCSTAHLRLAEP